MSETIREDRLRKMRAKQNLILIEQGLSLRRLKWFATGGGSEDADIKNNDDVVGRFTNN